MLQALVLLCGGKSSRFGSNKALVKVGGVPLIEQIVKQLKEIDLSLVLVTNTPEDYAFLNLPCLRDSKPYSGPLAALLTVFEKTSYDQVLLVACDMPRLENKLIQALLQQAPELDACVMRDAVGPQYLLGRYSRRLQQTLSDFVQQGGKSFKEFFQLHPAHLSFMDSEKEIPNVNTLQEWEDFKCSSI